MKNIKFLIITLTCIISASACAQVGISPRLLVLDENNINESQSFRLYNFTSKAIEVEVEISNWSMNLDNQIELLPSTSYSLDQWTVVNPLKFKVKAQSSQTIRLAFRPPAEIVAGEYRTMLYFNQILTDNDPAKKQLRSKFRIGAAVYLHVGKQNPEAEILSASLTQDQLSIEIKNSGNIHTRFNGKWYLLSSDPEPHILALNDEQKLSEISSLVAHDNLPTTPILPGHLRKLKIDTKDLKFDSKTPWKLLLIGRLAEKELNQVFQVKISSSVDNE